MLRYQKVEEHIKGLLNSTDYGPGDRLPSERDLAGTLGVNRLTVRRAVNNLIDAGLLMGNGTSGTRVASHKMIRRVDIYRSIGIHRVITGAGGTPSNKLLHFQITAADANIAERLKIAEGDEVIIVRRVWNIDNSPFCIETSYLVSRLMPGLTADDLVSGQSLYELLNTRYGLETINAERTITVSHVNDIEGRLLDLAPGTAVLALRLLVETKDKKPIEYMSSINNPKLVVFRTTQADQA